VYTVTVAERAAALEGFSHDFRPRKRTREENSDLEGDIEEPPRKASAQGNENDLPSMSGGTIAWWVGRTDDAYCLVMRKIEGQVFDLIESDNNMVKFRVTCAGLSNADLESMEGFEELPPDTKSELWVTMKTELQQEVTIRFPRPIRRKFSHWSHYKGESELGNLHGWIFPKKSKESEEPEEFNTF